MQENDDTKARIVFDLASKIAKISIRNFVIQEIVDNNSTIVLSNENPEISVTVYPNPATNELLLKNISNFKQLQIQSIEGKNITEILLNGENEIRVALDVVQNQQFIVILTSENRRIAKRIFR
jgi:hypothetical protein